MVINQFRKVLNFCCKSKNQVQMLCYKIRHTESVNM